MKNKYLVLPVLIAIVFFNIIPITARAATSFELYPVKVNVKSGQYFTLTVRVNPNGQKNYTVKTDIKFPSDQLLAMTWKYANGWIPLREEGFDASSNAQGSIVRTAGYPGGFNTVITFGTVTFLAKKTGQATIEFIGDNIALNDKGENIYGGGVSSLITVVTPSAVVSTTTPGAPVLDESAPGIAEVTSSMQAPEQLFDINLELDRDSVTRAESLGARAYFMSFGKVPTKVGLKFDILNENKEIVFTKEMEKTVTTEAVVNADLSGANLVPGKYILRLATLYNTNVQDEFMQPFTIIAPPVETPVSVLSRWYYIATAAGLLVVIILIIFFLMRRRLKKRGANKLN